MATAQPFLSLAPANKFAQMDHLSPSKDSDSLEAFTALGPRSLCTSVGIFIFPLFRFGDLLFRALRELHRDKTIKGHSGCVKVSLRAGGENVKLCPYAALNKKKEADL